MYKPEFRSTLDEIHQHIPEISSLWRSLGVDSSRLGHLSLEEVCRLQKLDVSTVVRLLGAMHASHALQTAIILELSSLPEICDHIEFGQHRRLREALEELGGLLSDAERDRLVDKKQLSLLRKTFTRLQNEFETHLQKEKDQLFACLRDHSPEGSACRISPEELRRHLHQFAHEHEHIDEILEEFRLLLEDEKLKRLRPKWVEKISSAMTGLYRMVHEQIYTENQVLFPRLVSGERG